MPTLLLSRLLFIILMNTLQNTEYVFGVQYEHSLQELELTRSVRIQQPKCRPEITNIFVHSAARTSGKYYDRRKVTRETWAMEALKHRFNVIFVLALSRDANTQHEILVEANRFGDILQFAFIDDYHNLTLKAIALLNWISNNCLVNDYVIKTDDDIVVNSQRLRERIDSKTFESGITGTLFTYSEVIRDESSKWFVPRHVYPKDLYPPYLCGAAYIMSTDIVEKLYNSAINGSGPVLKIDDLYLTGIIPQKFNIQIHNSQELFLSESDTELCGINACKLYTISTFHSCESVDKTLQLWNSWKNTTLDSCHNYFIKLERSTRLAMIALIVSIVLLLTFVLSMIAIIYQYYTNYRDPKWQKVKTST